MKIRALTSFVGAVDMVKGEAADVPERLAVSLIARGFAEEIKEADNIEAKRNNGRGRKKSVTD